MSNDVKKKISEYLASHPYLNLATVSPDGTPLAHTVGYASDGPTVYFVTDKKTRKARNIAGCPFVAYTVDEDYASIEMIQGVQIRGRAELVKDNAVIDKILGIMNKKYSYMKDLPKNPDYVFFKINPLEADFIDNTRGFGNRDHVSF